MNSAKTAVELAEMLPEASWYSKLPSHVLAKFLASVKYVDGHVAHMEHSEIQSTLSTQEFAEFLAIAGISDKEFQEGNGYTCVGQIGARNCVPGAGYCVSAYCH